MRLENNYIRVYSGRKVWPLDLHTEDIDIVDIAHALSNQCRFTGHSSEFYSVAQHSLEVSKQCPPELKLAGLLHDGDEAYLVDLAKPLKYGPGFEAFNELGKDIEFTIFAKYGIPSDQAKDIKHFDQLLYEWEREQFMPSGTGKVFTKPMLPREAERKFLNEFYRLTCREVGPNDHGTAKYGSSGSNEIRFGQTVDGPA